VPRMELNIEIADSDRRSGAALPVAGSLRDETGVETAFVGWVGLLSLLEQALALPVEVPDAS
jgi:hypothetical protein